MQSGWGRAYATVTIAMAAVIVYGSLYPFDFAVPPAAPGPLATLLRSWAEKPGRGDFLANILLYAPFGFFASLALSQRARPLFRFLLVLVIGALLSVSMELTQYYDPGRVTAATDVYANALGTSLGALAANLVAANLRWSWLAPIRTHRIPVLLLIAWLAYKLYPFVPTIDLHKYWSALKPLVIAPVLSPYDLFRYTAVWLTVYSLVGRVGERTWPFLLFPLFAGAVLSAKVLTVWGTLTPVEVLGAGLAYLIWAVFGRMARAYRALNILLLGCAILALRLEPFHLIADPAPFGWIPFRSFMHGSINVDVLSFLEKFFLYGSWIWLLNEAGLTYARAGCLIVAPMLFGTSWVERYLPSRSAEITDALIAIAISVIFTLIARADTRSPRWAASVHSRFRPEQLD